MKFYNKCSESAISPHLDCILTDEEHADDEALEQVPNKALEDGAGIDGPNLGSQGDAIMGQAKEEWTAVPQSGARQQFAMAMIESTGSTGSSKDLVLKNQTKVGKGAKGDKQKISQLQGPRKKIKQLGTGKSKVESGSEATHSVPSEGTGNEAGGGSGANDGNLNKKSCHNDKELLLQAAGKPHLLKDAGYMILVTVTLEKFGTSQDQFLAAIEAKDENIFAGLQYTDKEGEEEIDQARVAKDVQQAAAEEASLMSGS